MHQFHDETDFDLIIRHGRLLAVIAGWASARYFDEIARVGPATLDVLDGDQRALKISARILASTGLLDRDGDVFSLSERGHHFMQMGLLSGDRHIQTLHQLGRMESVLREGGPVPDEKGRRKPTDGGVVERDDERNRAFMDMLYRRSENSARVSARHIAALLEPGSTILDVGGGHGRYATAFADEGLRPTLMDKSFIVDYARERHGDALSYVAGDFFEDDLGGPYDAVFLSNIVHGLGADENLRLLHRLNDALNPGGLVIIKDRFIDEKDGDDDGALFFSLTMLLFTEYGDSPELTQALAWLRRTGLEPLQPVGHQGHDIDEDWRLLMARKPGR